VTVKAKVRGGRITIPSELREKIGIHEGDYVELLIINSMLTIIPPYTVPNPVETLTGLAESVKLNGPIKKELIKASAELVNRKIKRSTETLQ
jgi:AbrB family looped-hinge helix DNA binding protein